MKPALASRQRHTVADYALATAGLPFNAARMSK